MNYLKIECRETGQIKSVNVCYVLQRTVELLEE